MYSVKDSKKELKNIKARMFLNQEIDENEIFSIAINAKNRSDQRSFDGALNNLPLSRDIVQCSRRYNAPYWAKDLNIFKFMN